MSTSSAASERNFSTFGFVHSKLRNSLSIESVDKLVFIKTNYRLFTDDTSLELEEIPSDDEQSEQSGAEGGSDSGNENNE